MKERFKRFLQELMLVEQNEKGYWEGSGLSQSQSQGQSERNCELQGISLEGSDIQGEGEVSRDLRVLLPVYIWYTIRRYKICKLAYIKTYLNHNRNHRR